MTGTPDCTCLQLTGTHDERCAIIRHVRGLDGQIYEPDLEIPAFLDRRRPRPAAGVFD